MIEFDLDIKFKMEPWKKALVSSFFYHLVLIIIVLFIATVKIGEFNSGLMFMIFSAYFIFLILTFRYIYKLFENKFSSLTG